jgi:hypothetical protein
MGGCHCGDLKVVLDRLKVPRLHNLVGEPIRVDERWICSPLYRCNMSCLDR